MVCGRNSCGQWFVAVIAMAVMVCGRHSCGHHGV